MFVTLMPDLKMFKSGTSDARLLLKDLVDRYDLSTFMDLRILIDKRVYEIFATDIPSDTLMLRIVGGDRIFKVDNPSFILNSQIYQKEIETVED